MIFVYNMSEEKIKRRGGERRGGEKKEKENIILGFAPGSTTY